MAPSCGFVSIVCRHLQAISYFRDGVVDRLQCNLSGGVNLRYIFRLFCQNIIQGSTHQYEKREEQEIQRNFRSQQPWAWLFVFWNGGNPWKLLYIYNIYYTHLKILFDSRHFLKKIGSTWNMTLKIHRPQNARPVNLISSRRRSHKVTGFWIETYGSMKKLQHTQAFPQFPDFFGPKISGRTAMIVNS